MSIESVVQEEYVRAVDSRLASYDAYIEYQMREAERAVPFLERFMAIDGARVLEVGAGRGGKGIAYACKGMQITSLDIDLPSLALGRQAALSRGAPVEFLAGDGSALPFREGEFGAVLLDSVLEHVREPQRLMDECQRVLEPGGILFVVFPPHYGPLSGHIDDYILTPWFHLLPRETVRRALLSRPSLPGILSPEDAYKVYTTLNGLTIRSFRAMAHRSGFKIEYQRVRPFLTHPGTRLAAGLAAAVRSRSLGSDLGLVLSRARREFDFKTALLFLLLSALAPFVFVPVLQEIAAGGVKAVLLKPHTAGGKSR